MTLNLTLCINENYSLCDRKPESQKSRIDSGSSNVKQGGSPVLSIDRADRYRVADFSYTLIRAIENKNYFNHR